MSRHLFGEDGRALIFKAAPNRWLLWPPHGTQPDCFPTFDGARHAFIDATNEFADTYESWARANNTNRAATPVPCPREARNPTNPTNPVGDAAQRKETTP